MPLLIFIIPPLYKVTWKLSNVFASILHRKGTDIFSKLYNTQKVTNQGWANNKVDVEKDTVSWLLYTSQCHECQYWQERELHAQLGPGWSHKVDTLDYADIPWASAVTWREGWAETNSRTKGQEWTSSPLSNLPEELYFHFPLPYSSLISTYNIHSQLKCYLSSSHIQESPLYSIT